MCPREPGAPNPERGCTCSLATRFPTPCLCGVASSVLALLPNLLFSPAGNLNPLAQPKTPLVPSSPVGILLCPILMCLYPPADWVSGELHAWPTQEGCNSQEVTAISEGLVIHYRSLIRAGRLASISGLNYTMAGPAETFLGSTHSIGQMSTCKDSRAGYESRPTQAPGAQGCNLHLGDLQQGG